MALFPPSPWPCITLAFPSSCSGPSFGCIKTFQNIYIPLCVHGLRRAVASTCFRPASALHVCLVLFLLPVSGWLLFSPVLCLSLRLGFLAFARKSGLPRGNRDLRLREFPVFGLRKTFAVSAALRPAGRQSNENVRGNFGSLLQKFP